MSFVYEFEWDRSKALANLTKHAVDFKLAATVFKDPLAATIFDDDHSGDEQRWVTIGKDQEGRYISFRRAAQPKRKSPSTKRQTNEA
jgi:uncharacterized DUF497 family protein